MSVTANAQGGSAPYGARRVACVKLAVMTTKAELMSTQVYLTPARVAAMIPWLSLGLLLAFAGLAYWQVGHWPMYGRPDPKDVVVPFAPQLRIGGFMTLLVALSTLASLVAALTVALYTACEVAESSGSMVTPNASRALVAFSVCGCGLYVFLLALAAHMNWLLDSAAPAATLDGPGVL